MSDAPTREGRARVAYVSLGCRVNRVETDAIAQALKACGLVLAPEREADAIVINSCAVTGEAEAKARKAVRHAALLPQRPTVVVTGCLASLRASSVEALGSGVVVEPVKSEVARRVLDELELGGRLSEGQSPSAPSGFATATGRTRPGIKIQDGCDLRCSYCIVWKARGPSRSVGADEVERQVREAVALGASELMLTGINLGCYGYVDADGERLDLAGLIEQILRRTGVARLRLGSIEPQDVDERLVEVIAGSDGRVAPFLHMCLQSGSDTTLRRMRRVYDRELFEERVALVRARLPHASIGTDLIVGFPGEDEAAHRESLAFCAAMRFSRMHVFRYSARPGTPAASMGGQVEPIVAARRSAEARALAKELRHAEARALVGTEDLVCVQAPGRGVTGGLFDATLKGSAATGSLVRVRVTGVSGEATLDCESL